MTKRLLPGYVNFVEFIHEEGFVIDRSAAIKPLLLSDVDVLIVTRPHGFGKTCFFDMLRCFLQVDRETPGNTQTNATLFSDFAISKDKPFCDAFLGRIPVIALSFQHIQSNTFESAASAFANKMVRMSSDFRWLIKSDKLSEADLAIFEQYLTPGLYKTVTNKQSPIGILKHLAKCLSKAFGQRIIIWIDAFDVPLNAAQQYGYLDQMIDLLQTHVGEILDDASKPVQKIILSGEFPWEPRLIFKKPHKITVDSVLSMDPKLGDLFGFTDEEVNKLFKTYQIERHLANFKRWHQGFMVAGRPLYRPVDVIRYTHRAMKAIPNTSVALDNDWQYGKADEVLKTLVGTLLVENHDIIESLVNGEFVTMTFNETIRTSDYAARQSVELWQWLLHKGYLTIHSKTDQHNTYRVALSNALVREVFVERLKARFSPDYPAFVNDAKAFVEAATKGNTTLLTLLLNKLFRDFIFIKEEPEKRQTYTQTQERRYWASLEALIQTAAKQIPTFRIITDDIYNLTDPIVVTVGHPTERLGIILNLQNTDTDDLESTSQTLTTALKTDPLREKLNQHRAFNHILIGVAVHENSVAVCSEKIAQP